MGTKDTELISSELIQSPPTVTVPDRYRAGQYGVEAVVTIPAGDVEIMNIMIRMANALPVLATRMGGLQGHMDSTRALIKQCRMLAIDIQEELEKRWGPQGGVRGPG